MDVLYFRSLQLEKTSKNKVNVILYTIDTFCQIHLILFLFYTNLLLKANIRQEREHQNISIMENKHFPRKQYFI